MRVQAGGRKVHRYAWQMGVYVKGKGEKQIQLNKLIGKCIGMYGGYVCISNKRQQLTGI